MKSRAWGFCGQAQSSRKLASGGGFRGENVKRGERLVHEEHFGLDDESAGDPDTLLHSTGKFLGVGGFKTVKADGVNDAQGAFAAFDGRHAAGLERGFDVFKNGEPGE